MPPKRKPSSPLLTPQTFRMERVHAVNTIFVVETDDGYQYGGFLPDDPWWESPSVGVVMVGSVPEINHCTFDKCAIVTAAFPWPRQPTARLSAHPAVRSDGTLIDA